MPTVPDDAVQAAAGALRGIIDPHGNLPADWPGFSSQARTILEAAAPVLAGAVAAKITAHMEAFGPREPVGALEPASDVGRRYRAWRRHLGIAAQVAAGAFSTREDQLREAARAIAEGNYIACTEGQ